jgi:formate-nitrite transporter family protein
LMAWLLPAVKGSRPHLVVVMTYVVALGQFAHIIAGSVECAFLVQSGLASLSQYASDFFVPTLLGNILGGTTLVALLNYGQVAPEIDDHRE